MVTFKVEGCNVTKVSKKALRGRIYNDHTSSVYYMIDGIYCQINKKEGGFHCTYCEAILVNVGTFIIYLKRHKELTFTKSNRQYLSSTAFKDDCAAAKNVHSNNTKLRDECYYFANAWSTQWQVKNRLVEMQRLKKLLPQKIINCIIYTKYLALLIIIYESYGRSANIDAHMESSGDSIPSQYTIEERRYESLTCNIVSNQADGGGGTVKLILGTKIFNILCTSSLLIFPENVTSVNVGPSVDEYTASIDLSKAHIFFVTSRVEQFNNSFDKMDDLPNLEDNQVGN